MLKLVSLPNLLMARASAKWAAYKNAIYTLLVMTGLFAAGTANAQDLTMPKVNITGIDDSSDGSKILIVIIKLVARIAIWVAMAVSGLVALKTILKSWNEQKSNDQGKWGAVVGDSLGSVIMVILVIAIGTWALSFIK